MKILVTWCENSVPNCNYRLGMIASVTIKLINLTSLIAFACYSSVFRTFRALNLKAFRSQCALEHAKLNCSDDRER